MEMEMTKQGVPSGNNKEKTENVLEGLLKEHPVTVRFREEGTFIEKFENVLTDQGGSMEQHSYLQSLLILKVQNPDSFPELSGRLLYRQIHLYNFYFLYNDQNKKLNNWNLVANTFSIHQLF